MFGFDFNPTGAAGQQCWFSTSAITKAATGIFHYTCSSLSSTADPLTTAVPPKEANPPLYSSSTTNPPLYPSSTINTPLYSSSTTILSSTILAYLSQSFSDSQSLINGLIVGIVLLALALLVFALIIIVLIKRKRLIWNNNQRKPSKLINRTVSIIIGQSPTMDCSLNETSTDPTIGYSQGGKEIPIKQDYAHLVFKDEKVIYSTLDNTISNNNEKANNEYRSFNIRNAPIPPKPNNNNLTYLNSFYNANTIIDNNVYNANLDGYEHLNNELKEHVEYKSILK